MTDRDGHDLVEGPFARAELGARYLAEDLGIDEIGPVDTVMVCGSGWGSIGDALQDGRRVAAGERYLLPKPAVGGHAGEIVLGRAGDQVVLAFVGRVHLYEGYSAEQVAHPVRMANALGARTLVSSNAAGAIAEVGVGEVVAISDHVNLTGANPLEGPLDTGRSRFVDLVGAYDRELIELARSGWPGMTSGVYAALRGPSYETVAEIEYLARAGVDLVGMSTVCETVAARHVGMRVAGLTLVSNRAAGRGTGGLAHSEVTEVGRSRAGELAEFTIGFLSRIR